MNVYFCVAFIIFLFNAISMTMFVEIEFISHSDMLALIINKWADLGTVTGLWILHNIWRKHNVR